jgi:hypothetical protein
MALREDRRGLAPGERERRRQLVEPLFRYCRERGISVAHVVRRACMRRGVEPFSGARIWQIQAGNCVAPEWLVAECCRVLERRVETVMGAAWIAEFGSGHALSEQGQRKAS